MEGQPLTIKKDLIAALIIGEILAWLIIPIAKASLSISLYEKLGWLIKGLPLYFPFICVICLYLAYLINRKFRFIYQAAKFVLVGGTNTLLDWAVLALLLLVFEQKLAISQNDIFVFGIIYYSLFKAVAYIIATVNSYLWNKFWTFTRKSEEKVGVEFIQFMAVTAVGFLVNVAIASFVVGYIQPLAGLNDNQWAMLAAVVATAVSMVWNFLGYKFIVFDVKK